MVANINGLPVFDAVMLDEETGMMRISLVDDPAVMSLFQSFSSDTAKAMKYAVQDEERRLVRGVVMRADFPIYRYDESGEYYIIYKADTIRRMAEKYLADGRQNLVNLMHRDGSDVEGVQMVQYFIKGNGVSVEGFDDIADGSLFAEFHVTNDEVWNAIKEGTYKGFSLEGVFNVVPDTDPDEVNEIADALEGLFSRISNRLNKIDMSKVNRLKAAIAKLLAMEFGNITTDRGVLSWDGDEDLKEGDSVFVEDEEGNRNPAEDGDYVTEDNKTIVVVDGKVAEIRDPEAEVAPADEPAEGDTPAEGAEMPVESVSEESEPTAPSDGESGSDGNSDEINSLLERIAELEAENAALREENEALKGQVEEMQRMSAAKPAHEEVETAAKLAATGNKGLDRLARYLNAR